MKLYIFVGMYNGLNDRVEPYANEADAEKAWEDYTEHKFSDFEEDNYLLEHTKYEGSTIYATDFPMECYNPAREIAIKWSIDDVKIVRADLSEEQSLEVLEKVKSKHDAEMGVSWTTLEEWVNILFPLPSDLSDNEKLIETAARLYKANEAIADYTVHDALNEAAEIHGIKDFPTDDDDEQSGEYEDLVYDVKKTLGIWD